MEQKFKAGDAVLYHGGAVIYLLDEDEVGDYTRLEATPVSVREIQLVISQAEMTHLREQFSLFWRGYESDENNGGSAEWKEGYLAARSFHVKSDDVSEDVDTLVQSIIDEVITAS